MARFALVPAIALYDPRLRHTHLRLLLVLSIAQTDADGWCRCSPEDLGKAAGNPKSNGVIQPIPPDEIVRLLGELQAWGYVEAYTGRDGSRAYRMILDLPPNFLPPN